MKLSSVVAFWAILIGPQQAMAQDRNLEIMKTLYDKLEVQLGATSLDGGYATGALILANPGFILDKSIDWAVPANRKLVYDLIDNSVESNWFLRFKASQKVSQIYNSILTYHDPAPASLSATEKAKLAEARKVLYLPGPNNPWSRKYLEVDAAKAAYFQAQDDLNDWQRSHPEDVPSNMQLLKVQQAYDLYFNGPNYAEVMIALDTITTLGARDPGLYWQQLRNDFKAGVLAVGATQVAQVDFYPTYKSWFDPSIRWNSLQLSDSDIQHSSSSSTTSWGGGGSAGWGLWSVGGSYGETVSTTMQQFDTKEFSLSFELMRVRISRNWLHGEVFGARTWRWGDHAPLQNSISDGPNSNGSAPTGLEPLVVTELLLARNVKLTGNWGSGLATTYHKEVKASGHVGWGPFSFGANYAKTYDEASDRTQVTDNSIESPEVQIIGVLVGIRPRTPDPDPSLWPGQNFAAAGFGPFKFGGSVLLPSQEAQLYANQYRQSVLPMIKKMQAENATK